MQRYFIEQAPTYDEAERKAREKYGDRVTILIHETVKIRGGLFNLFPREGVKLTGIIPTANRIGQYREAAAPREIPLPREIPREPPRETPAEHWPQKATLDFNEEKAKILAAANAGKNNPLKEVLDEVRIIKERLESQGLAGSREEHPTLNRIDDILILNDFPSAFRKKLLEKIRKEVSLDALDNYDGVQDKVLEWIGESIRIYGNDAFKVRPRIMILVGPTGVGKTTTVAKLAANFGIDEKARHKKRITLVSIDAYRIGAREQLEKYCTWMDFPFFSTSDYDDLKKIIAVNSEKTDIFLIDTIGKNPRDMVKLGEMKQLLDACGSLTEVFLVVAATTKSSDLDEILRQFESFNYRSVIVTKMDETIRTGNIIGALSEKGKPVSYITNGQDVPTDIQKASVVKFLINLEGFKVNRIKMEERFPDTGQAEMQKWLASGEVSRPRSSVVSRLSSNEVSRLSSNEVSRHASNEVSRHASNEVSRSN